MKKNTGIKVFFAGEIILFSWFYYAGANGIKAMKMIQHENHAVEQAIGQIRTEIETIKNEIVCWKEDEFYKEKLAREELHMAREDEEIYLI